MQFVLKVIKITFILAKRIVKFFYHDTKVIFALMNRNKTRQSSIVSVHLGDKRFTGGNFAIFLIWQPNGIPWYVTNAIVALNNTGVNIIAVVNNEITSDIRKYLQNQCHTLLIRDNSGYDIGGYKDASIFVDLNFSDISRVIYMNDSVYYFKENISELFIKLINSPFDICGTFENREKKYHIQSFCFSVSGRLFKNSKFQKFWNDYLPVNSRLWAINEGEIALSQTMLPLSDQYEILYNASDLVQRLKDCETSSLFQLNKYLPQKARFTEGEFDLLSPQQATAFIVQRIQTRSQIHTGAFLFKKYLNCPIMKRDLVYRLQFTASEISTLMSELQYGEAGELVLQEMEKKGTPRQLSLIKQLRVAVGIL
ncbi:rhamnan synthesis F family protein [Brucella pseudogrignonensis]|uniref:rhamnan synthesis F family protein n=1 Tax=Brucella pseudogrignonensis TaxID=419475 RepID=UPI0038B47A38